MGLSFHYSGRFNPAASLGEMITEVEEIARTHQWPYVVYERSFPEKGFDKQHNDEVYGISFTPPGCETVFLCFLSDGGMSSFLNLKLYGDPEETDFPEFLYMLSVKTQYAGIETHIQIMKLLKYLNKKYFLDFEVHDEGNYWETEDEAELTRIFQRYDMLIASFKAGLESIPIDQGESVEDYIKRIAEHVRMIDVDSRSNNPAS